jgi:hypothetical protein
MHAGLPDPDEVFFAHKYEVVCANTGDRLLTASETMEQLMRDKTCCNTPDRSIQPYSLFVLTYEGKGLFTATRDPKVRI